MKIDGMKIAAFFAVLFGLALAFALYGENVSTNADYVSGENSQVLVTSDMRALAGQVLGANADAILHAAALTMAKYDSDMKSQSGRRAWHGKMIREEVFTNALCKIEVYSNEVTGAIWRYRQPFKPVPKAVRSARKVSYSTNGIPARLAAARAARASVIESDVITTNIVHTANQ